MTPTLFFIILATVGVIFLVIVGIVAFTVWRRNRDQGSGQQAAAVDNRLQNLGSTNPENGTEDGTSEGGATSEAASAATTSTDAAPTRHDARRDAPVPISALQQPEAVGDKIRILIVDDNPGTRDNVGRLLYFEKDMEVIGQAIDGRQGIEMAVDLRPHIVLMDINMPDIDGITATSEMSLKTPYCQVIIMSVQAEQHYMKQAMAAGARDFQPKPFTAEELVGTIRRVYNIGLPIYRQIEAAENVEIQRAASPQAPAQQKSQGGVVIAVYSAKGGIGTSTISANLAVALQQQIGEVALVDADLQFGDVFVHLNTRPSRTISDAIHAGAIDLELIPEVMVAHNSGLKLLLGPPQPEMADEILSDMMPKVLNELKHHFKAVIVDTATPLNDRNLNVLDTADHILYVTGPELPAIKSAKLFLELAQQLEWSADQIEVVMNRADLPGGIPVAKIEAALKVKQSYQIPNDPRIHEAINKGVAVIQQDAGAPSAKALTHIATQLWHKLGTPEVSAEIAHVV